MDRLAKYKKIVRETLTKHLGFPTRDFPNLQDILVVDAQEKHFLFLTVGWEKDEYVHDTVYHFEVRENGEVWIHQCNSTAEIDRELVEGGVAETDLKVGMLDPPVSEEQLAASPGEVQGQRA